MSTSDIYKDMKAISVWQPWAWAIMSCIKSIETRNWRPPHALIGKRIAIHSARKVSCQAVMHHVACLCARDELVENLPYLNELHRGALLGTVKLAGVKEYLNTEDFFADGDKHLCSDEELFEPVRFGWILEEPEVWQHPKPYKGMQRFFSFNLETEFTS